MSFESCPLVAWERIQHDSFDVVVTDVRMPGITGLELLERSKKNRSTEGIAFIVVTGESDQALKRSALDLDAADLLNKPIHRDDLVARLRSVIRAKQFSDEICQHNELLEQRVLERTAELAASRIDTLWKLGKASELRDEETGNHIVRVGGYSRVVAKSMGFDDDLCDTLYLAAPLHDVGKIGVSDTILLKPGKLSDEDWRAMRQHCEIGHKILTDPCDFSAIESKEKNKIESCALWQSEENSVIEMAATIAISHHEKWDGGGYPAGDSGEAIPIEGRIVAIADVYDALRSERPYKNQFSVEQSLDIIKGDSGTHFDPKVVDAFIDNFAEIEALENQLRDSKTVCDSNELQFAAV